MGYGMALSAARPQAFSWRFRRKMRACPVPRVVDDEHLIQADHLEYLSQASAQAAEDDIAALLPREAASGNEAAQPTAVDVGHLTHINDNVVFLIC